MPRHRDAIVPVTPAVSRRHPQGVTPRRGRPQESDIIDGPSRALRRLKGSLADGVPVLLIGSAPAMAGSAAQPGQTVGLPTGARLPVGLYFVDTSSFGIRATRPLDSESNINLPAFVWSTPWSPFGARLNLVAIQPVVASSSRGAPYQSGIGQPLPAGQLA